MKKMLVGSLVCLILWLTLLITPDPEIVQPQDWQTNGLLAPRSPKWEHIRAKFVKEHPTCAACGSSYNLNVHHIEPFHLNPSLELDPNNLITLCRDDHFVLGHLRNWKKSNPNVVEDSKSKLNKGEHK